MITVILVKIIFIKTLKCKKSVSKISLKDLQNIEIIIDLANISNDPASELDPNFTKVNNYLNKIRLINMLKKINYFSKYIYISSCSVYGFNDKFVNEKAKQILFHFMQNIV